MTEKPRFTPGPWAATVPPSSCHTTRFISGPNGEHVAKVGHMDYTQGVYVDVANARLIAKAPEMAEVLAALFEHCAMVHKIWGDGSNQAEADAAIQRGRALLAEIDAPA